MRAAAMVALAVALALAGCGGEEEPGPTPAAFVRTLLRDLEQGRPGSAWEALHPAHQAAVPRGLYVRCERGSGFGGRLTRIDVREVAEAEAAIPGTDGRRPSTAVTVDVTLQPDGGAAPESFTLTAHLFEEDGRLTWVIGAADYAAYAEGRCPS